LQAAGARGNRLDAMAAGRDEHALGAQAERLAASGDRAAGSVDGDGRPAPLVVAAYLGVGGVAAGLSLALGRNPLVCEGWLGAQGAASWLVSLGLGLVLGATTIAVTPAMVRRWRWARALHLALRPAVHRAGDAALLSVALASAVGEELLFRGLLVPLVGVVASSAAFGLLHQIRGRARWGWMGWAALMGLLFGEIFAMTGSLVGPLIAHAAINHSNLRFLRDNDPDPPRRPLGGLLRR
jgi:membrane protease YdiL (CAAX protease family)